MGHSWRARGDLRSHEPSFSQNVTGPRFDRLGLCSRRLQLCAFGCLLRGQRQYRNLGGDRVLHRGHRGKCLRPNA